MERLKYHSPFFSSGTPVARYPSQYELTTEGGGQPGLYDRIRDICFLILLHTCGIFASTVKYFALLKFPSRMAQERPASHQSR